ncbi:MAG: ketoacyl-ACP synthase III [Flavobacteriaceae bacterium]|nr:ketoacyl-ACP synthase III [Flavobacteriaceae bacterium]
MQPIITGTGSFIPDLIKKNTNFLNSEFYNENFSKIPNSNEVIIKKFKAITGIEERRYLKPEMKNSDMATFAAKKAIEQANINIEEIDYIILGQNFGNINYNQDQSDFLPSIASRVKHNLGIKNPNCVAYDIVFGCPGWIEGVIQANAFIKSGMAKKCLVIGSETLSRVVDKYDRDSMIYADGAGACILEINTNNNVGILSHATQTFALKEAYYLYFGKSYNPEIDENISFIKMHGRKIYEFALINVPNAMKIALNKSGLQIENIKKILIHQANEKMDEAIIKRFYDLYNQEMPKDIMPMSIHKLGNSSVATVPTLLDLILKGKLENHQINKGDAIILASVGAGMNINAIVYQY